MSVGRGLSCRLDFLMPVASVVMSQHARVSPEHAITVHKKYDQGLLPRSWATQRTFGDPPRRRPWEGWPSQRRMVAFGGSLGCMARLARAMSVSQASNHYLVCLQAAPPHRCWCEGLTCISLSMSLCNLSNQQLQSSSRTAVSTLLPANNRVCGRKEQGR
jgi:hypothetical protein